MGSLVSIIIPVYKVEKYLNRCIESIVAQTYNNLEILLIDDGSPDNCPQICDEWAKRDSRVKVIHQENSGIGVARNVGIEQAAGEYLCFFDSDDYIRLDTIECAYTAAIQNDADMVCFGMDYINSEGVKTKSRTPKYSRVYRGEEVQKAFLPGMAGRDPKTGEDLCIPLSACCKMFSMRTIKKSNWRFVSERELISEDYYSVLKLCADVETVCVLPVAYYNYCQNNASISHSYQKNRFERVCYFYSEVKKLCKELHYEEEVSYRLGGEYLGAVVATMKQEVASDNSVREKRKAIRNMLNHEMVRCVLKERKNRKVSTTMKMLLWAMRHRWVDFCYVLILARKIIT